MCEGYEIDFIIIIIIDEIEVMQTQILENVIEYTKMLPGKAYIMKYEVPL